MVDKQALLETLERVKIAARLNEWDQREWLILDSTTNYCKTIGCFVGWRAVLDGAVLAESGMVQLPNGQRIDDIYYQALSAAEIDWRDYAAQRFDITEHDAEILWDTENTLEDLERIVDILCKNA